MKKIRNIILSFLLFILLVGCECDICGGIDSSYYSQGSTYFGFEKSEIVIDVTPETDSFRIVVNCNREFYGQPPIEIDRDATTAKHDEHFVNTPDNGNYIGGFAPLEGVEKIQIYKDFKIMPGKITEKVVIAYTMSNKYYYSSEPEPEGLIKELTVILQPKVSN